MSFGGRIKEARLLKGLTQAQLGACIGVANTTITGYEKGNAYPDEQKLYALISALGVDANYLFQDEMKTVVDECVITEYEHSHIKKYRDLDDHGRKTVDIILNSEYERVKQIQDTRKSDVDEIAAALEKLEELIPDSDILNFVVE